MSIPHDKFRIAWESLIAQGIAVPTGEMRPNSKGELVPVYVHRDWAKAMGLPLPPLKTGCAACEGDDADLIEVERALALVSGDDDGGAACEGEDANFIDAELERPNDDGGA
jgi:hypothetical protein